MNKDRESMQKLLLSAKVPLTCRVANKLFGSDCQLFADSSPSQIASHNATSTDSENASTPFFGGEISTRILVYDEGTHPRVDNQPDCPTLGPCQPRV